MYIQAIDKWLTKLDLKVFDIEFVYRSSGNVIPEVDNLILKRKNLIDYLEIWKYKVILLNFEPLKNPI